MKKFALLLTLPLALCMACTASDDGELDADGEPVSGESDVGSTSQDVSSSSCGTHVTNTNVTVENPGGTAPIPYYTLSVSYKNCSGGTVRRRAITRPIASDCKTIEPGKTVNLAIFAVPGTSYKGVEGC